MRVSHQIIVWLNQKNFPGFNCHENHRRECIMTNYHSFIYFYKILREIHFLGMRARKYCMFSSQQIFLQTLYLKTLLWLVSMVDFVEWSSLDADYNYRWILTPRKGSAETLSARGKCFIEKLAFSYARVMFRQALLFAFDTAAALRI